MTPDVRQRVDDMLDWIDECLLPAGFKLTDWQRCLLSTWMEFRVEDALRGLGTPRPSAGTHTHPAPIVTADP